MAILNIPRLVIGAAQGRTGKTTVSLGLCAAFAGRGLVVQPFKKGPDYIDPSWLSEGAGRACRTLDPFFHRDAAALLAAFLTGVRGAEISLVEGNHGLFDSLTEDGSGSTAAVARALAAPVLLVVNAARMGRSAAALVQGYLNFERGTPIKGVILNNVARGRHEAKMRQAIEQHCGLPVLGALPRDPALAIPDRHLGLVPREEDGSLLPAIAACREAAERYLDLHAILAIARDAPALEAPDAGATCRDVACYVSTNRGATDRGATGRVATDRGAMETPGRPQESRVRLAVFRDAVFTFYYPENLEALEAAGAELVFLDALRDTALPPVSGLVIGGGFPEMFMEALSANVALRRAVREAAEAGLPIYAECGGLMYLARRITWGERSAEMAGVLPCEIQMTDQPQGHGYVEATVDGENPFFARGTVLRGHEFHNSRLVHAGEDLRPVYRLARGNGCGGRHRTISAGLPGSPEQGDHTGSPLREGDTGWDGLVYRNVLASYTHLHAAGAPGWAAGLVEACRGSGI